MKLIKNFSIILACSLLGIMGFSHGMMMPDQTKNIYNRILTQFNNNLNANATPDYFIFVRDSARHIEREAHNFGADPILKKRAGRVAQKANKLLIRYTQECQTKAMNFSE